ncbi:MAG: alpha/beta hydrolase [Anaerolineae bacterium]|jgi:acetyl esterase/lipase|nr:alpha/beta hydrolase [Anaerolineae bacterium]
MRLLARSVAGLSLVTAIATRIRIRSGALDPSLFAFAAKMLGSAGAPVVGLAGAAAALSGWRSRDPLSALAGGAAALLSADFIRRVTTPHQGFERAFGPDWHAAIPPDLARRFLPRRWNGYLRFPVQTPSWANLAFWDVPGAPDCDNRRLLCDLWAPPPGASRSGLGVIYLHAGGWQNFAKDTGTRPFFSYLCRQGHVVMDVDYRMVPETDMAGMLADVKHAVVWLKDNASRLGVDPNRVVLTGASAGGQLALLAAYTPNDPLLDPADVRPCDTAVRGVIAFYAPTDMLAYGAKPAHDWPSFVRLGRRIGIVPRGSYLMWSETECRLFGARAADAPENARRFSPIAHAGPACPPTLLIHGAHDRVVAVADSRQMAEALRRHGVPAVCDELPMIDHAFDLPLLRLSPPAQAALYDVERFLGIMAGPRRFGSR